MNRKTYIPSNLKFLRISRGLTQEQLGKICGKSNSAISNYEQGTRDIEALDLIKIADYFNLTLDDLLTKDLRISDKNTEKIDIQTAKDEIESILKNSDMSEQQKMMVMTPLNYISSEDEKK